MRLGLLLLELVLALDPIVETVAEPFHLRRQDRQVCLLGLALRLPGHCRDHLGEQVEELLLGLDEMPIDNNPAAGFPPRPSRPGFAPDPSPQARPFPSRPPPPLPS